VIGRGNPSSLEVGFPEHSLHHAPPEFMSTPNSTSPSVATIVGTPLPNLPWQEKPAGHPHPVWRYSANPIIGRSPFPTCNSVFNSAAVPFEGRFAGVFRCNSTARDMQLHAGFSDDGFDWKIEPERIRFNCDDPEIGEWAYGLNPREPYECVGDVPNVVFPTAALCDGPSGRIAIYYGCADTVTGLAFCQVDEILDWIAA